MTMDHTPEPLPASPSNPPALDEAQLDALLRQTIAEHVAGVPLPPNALPRLNARLDAAHPQKRWFGSLRLAGAVAAALLLLALLTPVGRLAAAGVHDAAQTIVTTVKQIASGDGGASSTPPNAPNATSALGSRTAPGNGSGSPATGGTANPALATRAGTPGGTASQVAPLSPTPTPRGTNQPTVTGTAAGGATATSVPPNGTVIPVSTQDVPPAATVTTPSVAVGTTTATSTSSAATLTPAHP